jgi:hypothetical protein
MEQIFQYIQNYGFMTVFAGVALFFLIKFGFLKYRNLAKDLLDQNIAEPKNHMFFQKVDYILRYKLPEITLKFKGEYCEGRTILFRDMLKIKFKVWQEHIRKACDNSQDSQTNTQIGQDFLKATVDLVDEYERLWEQDGIPQNIIQKFHKWHDNHAQIFIDAIESITGGSSFNSKKEVINAILEISNAMLLLTILDAEKTLGDLNGELTGMTYKGTKLL